MTIEAYAAALAALGSLATAVVTHWTAERQRRLDMVPLLGLAAGKAVPKTRFLILDDSGESSQLNRLDFEKYPLLLYFRNLGKGPASLLAVDLDTPDIVCHIGTPISVGPGGDAIIKMWIPERDRCYDVRLALYYWDVEERCYCTQDRVCIVYHETEDPNSGRGSARLDWRVTTEKAFHVEQSRPSEVLHWPRAEPLHPFLV